MTTLFLRPARWVALVPLALAACSQGSSSTTSTNPITQTVAQSTATHATAVSCFDDFKKCLETATTTDALTACKEALAKCMPTTTGGRPPPPPDVCNPNGPGDGSGGGPGGGTGGGCHNPPDGGLPPPPPPPPPPPKGDPGMGGGGPGFPITPEGRADIAVCMAGLKLCLASGNDPAACTTAAHQCVHDALVADFQQICAMLEKACSLCPSPTPICVDIGKRCAAGLPFPDAP